MKLNLTHKDEPKQSFSLRLYESVHEQVRLISEANGISMQQFIVSAVNDALDKSKKG